jgi:hypothetical protein
MGFDKLSAEVSKGLNGNNDGIPMGFDRLNKYIGIRKSLFFLIGGNTGSGKTSFIDDCFVLNPLDWYISDKNQSDIKLQIWYRSMERSSTYKYAKWVCRKIFLDHGITLSVNKLLGWTEKMNEEEHKIFLSYKPYMDKMKEVVTLFEGPENSVGIAKDLRKYALQHGKIIQKDPDDEYSKVYVPNDPNTVTIVIIDHIGLLKTTKDQPTKKEAIDKMSSELQYARDFFGFTPVVVSQFNRSISNPMRLKAGDVEPQLEDFSDSSSTQNDADVVLALFDPVRYKVEDTSGYDLNKLKDEYGGKYFRSLRLLKNSYGADDIRIGLAFLGSLGIFKELPRKKDIMDSDYEEIINKSYFLK